MQVSPNIGLTPVCPHHPILLFLTHPAISRVAVHVLPGSRACVAGRVLLNVHTWAVVLAALQPSMSLIRP